MIDKASHFTPVELESFIIDRNINVDLYMKRNKATKPVLFCSRNTRFTDVNKRALLDNKVKLLYVASNDYGAHLEYIENNLENIMENKLLSENEKTSYVFKCADNIMDEVMVDPEHPDNYNRSQRFVKNYLSFISKKKDYFSEFQERLEDSYALKNHCLNVSVYALALAKRLGTTSFGVLENLGIGGLLHDIGMSTIRKDILYKKGPLDEGEWKVIRKHPERGVRLVEHYFGCNEEVLQIIRHHHERFDGTGYPDKLIGRRIPYLVKIVAVADIFDAIHSQRPYGDGLKVFDAFKVIVDNYKDKIDTDIVRTFILMFQRQ